MSVYLDNNRLAPVDPQVREAMAPLLEAPYGELHALHKAGAKSRAAYLEAMEKLYAAIHAPENGDIFVTSGRAENLSTLLMGVYLSQILTGRKSDIILSRRASPAELEAARLIESQGGRVSYLPLNGEGVVEPDTLLDYLTPRTALVSTPMVDEEGGIVQPIAELARVCRRYEVPFHTDATHAMGKIPVDVQEMEVDLLSLSSEPLHAPAGVGAIYLRDDVELMPMIFGARSHFERYRAGPLNLSGLVGLGKALELASDALDFEMEDVRERRDRLEEALTAIEGVRSPIPWALRIPNTLWLTVEGIESELLLYELDRNGIQAYSYTVEPFGYWKGTPLCDVLGLDPSLRHTTVGFALSRMNTDEEIDETIRVFTESVEYLREFSSRSPKESA